jgi:DNA excision repair protein ERCC-4
MGLSGGFPHASAKIFVDVSCCVFFENGELTGSIISCRVLAMIKIIIDSREDAPLPVRNGEVGTLHTGDYSVPGFEDYISIERKTIPDLVSSVTTDRKRFENECRRLKGFLFRRLLIIGSYEDIKNHNYRSKTNPKSVINTLWAWQARYDLPFVFAATADDGARLVEKWLSWFVYEMERCSDKLKNAKGE